MNRDDTTPGRSKVRLDRRDVLKGMGLVAGTAAVAPVVAGTAEAAETPEEQVKARYRETDHAKRFYALNRL
ncbi:MAG TPA: twin-arginine translocation signal domain-containing protein [Azospirillum sp.]|nr:twin-arginine translocation signal domain-containing protein [Azospirillum sp.]